MEPVRRLLRPPDMPVTLLCVSCGAVNSPSSKTCGGCARPVGDGVIEATPPATWAQPATGTFIVSIVIAFAGILALRTFGVSLLWMALFYGPLVAAYFAPRNAVAAAAWGGVTAAVGLFVCELLIEPDALKALLRAIASDHSEEANRLRVFAGFTLATLAVGTVSLVGAGVGELLGAPRRRRIAMEAVVALNPVDDPQAVAAAPPNRWW
jgi:hypothetical protein